MSERYPRSNCYRGTHKPVATQRFAQTRATNLQINLPCDINTNSIALSTVLRMEKGAMSISSLLFSICYQPYNSMLIILLKSNISLMMRSKSVLAVLIVSDGLNKLAGWEMYQHLLSDE